MQDLFIFIEVRFIRVDNGLYDFKGNTIGIMRHEGRRQRRRKRKASVVGGRTSREGKIHEIQGMDVLGAM